MSYPNRNPPNAMNVQKMTVLRTPISERMSEYLGLRLYSCSRELRSMRVRLFVYWLAASEHFRGPEREQRATGVRPMGLPLRPARRIPSFVDPLQIVLSAFITRQMRRDQWERGTRSEDNDASGGPSCRCPYFSLGIGSAAAVKY
jgi:hypothetical protein